MRGITDRPLSQPLSSRGNVVSVNFKEVPAYTYVSAELSEDEATLRTVRIEVNPYQFFTYNPSYKDG
jgi:hypothetical protein